jgi:hypothetical protein
MTIGTITTTTTTTITIAGIITTITIIIIAGITTIITTTTTTMTGTDHIYSIPMEADGSAAETGCGPVPLKDATGPAIPARSTSDGTIHFIRAGLC